MIWWALEVEVEFKEEDEEEQVIWWVLEVEVEFKEEGGGTGDLVDIGGRGGVQGGRTGSFKCFGGRSGVQ